MGGCPPAHCGKKSHEAIALVSVTPDYLQVIGIPLRAGRFLNDLDRDNTEPVVVIDETLARHAFRGQDAVGVVGRSALGFAGDDQSRVRDQMYYPFSQAPLRYCASSRRSCRLPCAPKRRRP